MFTDNKKKDLKSKCNACGNINNLDTLNKAGGYLVKNLPKNMVTDIPMEEKKKDEDENQGEDKKEDDKKQEAVDQLDEG